MTETETEVRMSFKESKKLSEETDFPFALPEKWIGKEINISPLYGDWEKENREYEEEMEKEKRELSKGMRENNEDILFYVLKLLVATWFIITIVCLIMK